MKLLLALQTHASKDNCVRKAVLLTRFVTFTKEFLRDAAAIVENGIPSSSYVSSVRSHTTSGCLLLMLCEQGLVDLKEAKTKEDVQKAYCPLYARFQAYFESESDVLQDPQLVKTFALLTNFFSDPLTPPPAPVAL